MAKSIRPSGSVSLRAFEKAASKVMPGLLDSIRRTDSMSNPVRAMVAFDREIELSMVNRNDPRNVSAYQYMYRNMLDVVDKRPVAVQRALADEYNGRQTLGEFRSRVAEYIDILERWKKKK